MYWRQLWQVHAAHSTLPINFSILGTTMRAISLSPWLYCQGNKMDHMKNFWVHCHFRFSALSDGHQALATLLCGCKGWRNSVDAGWRSGEPSLWMLPEQYQANRGWKLRFLCSEWGGRGNFHLSSHHESQVTDWRDGVVEVVVGNVACCWLVGLKRWDFRRKLKICDGKDSTKRRDNNLSCSSGTLWQVKGHNAKGMEQCKGELNLKISYWRNDRHQTPSWIWA